MFRQISGTRLPYLLRQMHAVIAVSFLTGCSSTAVVPPLDGLPPDASIFRVEITAQKFKFEPEIVKVPINTHVILSVESLDVQHGFNLERYGINIVIPAKGEGAVTFEFYARKPGTYAFKCSKFCGIKHPWMDGKLVVE